MTRLRSSLLLLVVLNVSTTTVARGQAPPEAQLSNGVLHVSVYLPDASKGFYRGTRFDWSGVIRSLEYKGHNFYGPWFSRTDPKVIDFVFDSAGITAGPCSAITGPVEEFTSRGQALGFDKAKAGETFVKIGVGALRRPDGQPYNPYRLYEIADGGKWSVHIKNDSIEFTQELQDVASGYGYRYTKVLRLLEGKPRLVLEHTLENTGRETIETSVYDHNFLVLDKQPIGPDFVVNVPFAIHPQHALNRERAQIGGGTFTYLRQIEGRETVSSEFAGFSKSASDYKITIENRRVGTGMRITGDRPLSKENLWSIRSVLAVEPFIDMSIEPGKSFTWRYEYTYYLLDGTTR